MRDRRNNNEVVRAIIKMVSDNMKNGKSPTGKKWTINTLKEFINETKNTKPDSVLTQEQIDVIVKGLNKLYKFYNPKIVGKSEFNFAISKKNTKSNKIKMKKLTINWFEGYEEDEPSKPRDYNSYKSAHDRALYLFNKELNASDDFQGYIKLSFTILFEDGETYNGRLDMSPREDDPRTTGNIFKKHITEYLNYLLYDDRSRITKEDKEEIKEFLNKYDLG